MKRQNPERIDADNPEWSEEDIAKAVPFSSLPAELQKLLSSSKQKQEEETPPSARRPAA